MDRKKANSNFLITINLNISSYDLSQRSREDRMKIINICKDNLTRFKANFWKYTKDAKKNTNLVGDFKANFEVGELKKFLHIHILVRCDDYCQLNFPKIREDWNNSLTGYSKGIHLDVKYIHDSMKSVEFYNNKQGNEIVV